MCEMEVLFQAIQWHNKYGMPTEEVLYWLRGTKFSYWEHRSIRDEALVEIKWYIASCECVNVCAWPNKHIRFEQEFNVISFEDVLDKSPEEVQTGLLFHLDILS